MADVTNPYQRPTSPFAANRMRSTGVPHDGPAGEDLNGLPLTNPYVRNSGVSNPYMRNPYAPAGRVGGPYSPAPAGRPSYLPPTPGVRDDYGP